MLPGQRYATRASIASGEISATSTLCSWLYRCEEVTDQERDVFAALAQRRNGETNDVQPEVEVLAKRAGGDLRLEVAIGRGDQADVDARVRAVGADALNLTGLEEAEEHDLHARAHLADFVEEDGAVRRHLEEAGLVAVGAGEAAADVAEQFGFEQRVGQARRS